MVCYITCFSSLSPVMILPNLLAISSMLCSVYISSVSKLEIQLRISSTFTCGGNRAFARYLSSHNFLLWLHFRSRPLPRCRKTTMPYSSFPSLSMQVMFHHCSSVQGRTLGRFEIAFPGCSIVLDGLTSLSATIEILPLRGQYGGCDLTRWPFWNTAPEVSAYEMYVKEAGSLGDRRN